MTRTTLDLDNVVLQELRRRSAGEGRPMGQIASELLAQALAQAEPQSPFVWSSRDLGTPLVDLEDKDAVARALGSG